MDFLQRRGHLFIWIFITTALSIGFITYAYYAIQAPVEGDIEMVPEFGSQTLDSIFVPRLNTDFILKQREEEKYIEVNVHQTLPITSLAIYQDSLLLGTIESKDKYYFQTQVDKIGELFFVDLITGDSL